MIDIDTLAAKLGFETEETAMLLEMFSESAQSSLQTLRSSIASEDHEQIRAAAHTIKGSAANLTLEPLYMQAKQIEDAARSGTKFDFKSAAEKLEEMIASIRIGEVL